jgi:hypothetical protein
VNLCLCLELDINFGSYNTKKSANFCIYNWWNYHSDRRSELWLWICLEQIDKSVFEFYISKEGNMFVTGNFIHSWVDIYENYTIHIQMVVQGILKHSTSISKTHIIFSFRENYAWKDDAVFKIEVNLLVLLSLVKARI